MDVIKQGMPLEMIEQMKENREARMRSLVERGLVTEEQIQAKEEEKQKIEEEIEEKKGVLATVISKDIKVDTLMHSTHDELMKMCKKRDIKCSPKDNKMELVEKLLANDPTIVTLK
jgi:hypothetical protein